MEAAAGRKARRVRHRPLDDAQPRACLTIERLPRSLQGKIQRSRVRDMVLARYAMTDGPYPKFEEKT